MLCERKETEMVLFVRDNKAICPFCSGLITARQNRYTCIDCRQEYIGIDEGRIEGEVMVECVEDGHEKRKPPPCGQERRSS